MNLYKKKNNIFVFKKKHNIFVLKKTQYICVLKKQNIFVFKKKNHNIFVFKKQRRNTYQTPHFCLKHGDVASISWIAANHCAKCIKVITTTHNTFLIICNIIIITYGRHYNMVVKSSISGIRLYLIFSSKILIYKTWIIVILHAHTHSEEGL